MKPDTFAHEKDKSNPYLTHNFEKKFIDPLIRFIPARVETYHLTLCTVLWNICIVLFSFLAIKNINWLWGVNIMIILQYITDHFDGMIGRKRDTGLVKWGFYMDHILDYIFMCCVLTGYYLIMNTHSQYLLFFTLAIFGSYMAHTFLSFTVTQKFTISFYGIGPTEIRLLFIIINTLLIFFGTTYMGVIVPYILIISFIGLCLIIYKTHKEIWEMDMEIKKKNSQKK